MDTKPRQVSALPVDTHFECTDGPREAVFLPRRRNKGGTSVTRTRDHRVTGHTRYHCTSPATHVKHLPQFQIHQLFIFLHKHSQQDTALYDSRNCERASWMTKRPA